MEIIAYADLRKNTEGGSENMGEQLANKGHKNDTRDFFEYGGVKIIIREHFNKEGKPIEKIIEESVMRQARADSRFVGLPQSKAS